MVGYFLNGQAGGRSIVRLTFYLCGYSTPTVSDRRLWFLCAKADDAHTRTHTWKKCEIGLRLCGGPHLEVVRCKYRVKAPIWTRLIVDYAAGSWPVPWTFCSFHPSPAKKETFSINACFGAVCFIHSRRSVLALTRPECPTGCWPAS